MDAIDKAVTREGIRVEIGQVWRDLDKRMNGRLINITRVDELNGLAHYKAARSGKVAIRRMHKYGQGFELVSANQESKP